MAKELVELLVVADGELEVVWHPGRDDVSQRDTNTENIHTFPAWIDPKTMLCKVMSVNPQPSMQTTNHTMRQTKNCFMVHSMLATRWNPYQNTSTMMKNSIACKIEYSMFEKIAVQFDFSNGLVRMSEYSAKQSSSSMRDVMAMARMVDEQGDEACG